MDLWELQHIQEPKVKSENFAFPIQAVRDDILATLRTGNRLVLTAPTGSGKTTQTPQFLWQSGAIKGQVIVLQPRRLAARLVAQWVASEIGCPSGDLVGYQTRHESKISARTIIRFMTEGLFLRLLQAHPQLPGVGAVVLDEFHERSLAADVSLALVKRLQQTDRPDLKLLVMSATLDTQKIAAYLDCPSVSTHGRLFPVNITYLPHRSGKPCWDLAAETLRKLLTESGPEGRGLAGDVLVFMPGMYEIRRTLDACRRVAGREVGLFALHSELPVREQDAALAPAAQPKVIVSTNVAETSITIPGVRYVIDAGLARVNRFDPRRGINVLLVEPIARSSADQRAGRAGRTAPGTCHRLWTEQDQRSRPLQQTPEIQRLDLAEVILQLKSLGIADVRAMDWLEPPEALAIAQAQRVLVNIGALEPTGQLSRLGATMARLPMHPRLSRMLVEAGRQGCLERAAWWTAFIAERDILLPQGATKFSDAAAQIPASDFSVLEAAFAAAQKARFDPAACTALGVHANACREVERTTRLFVEAASRAGLGKEVARGESRKAHTAPPPALLCCLLTAFPDHVAFFKAGAHRACALVGQRRGVLDAHSAVKQPGLILPVEITEIGAGQGQDVKTVLSLASHIELDWLRAIFPDRVVEEKAHVFNQETRCVEAVERVAFDDLVLSAQPRGLPDPDQAAQIIAQLVGAGELKLAGWDERVDQWINRVRCVGDWFPERRLIRYDDDERRLIVQEICAGAMRYSQVKDKPCLEAVQNALSWEDRRFVEQMAPESVQLPNGRGMKIEYQPGSPPRGRSKIQDFYDVKQHPLVAGGRQRVLLEILGPNYRPVQVTDDLTGFWKNLYPTLRKELARKYPRHEWR